MKSTESFPLHWPAGHPRTADDKRRQAAFKTKFGAAVASLLREVKLLEGQTLVISSNVKVKNDGMPYATEPNPRDPGVAIYFRLSGKPIALACDKWKYVEDNIRALALSIKAMRATERYGVSSMLDRVFQGFVALPDASARPWYEVLHVAPDAPLDEIRTAFRNRSKQVHPDVGGSDAQQHEVIQAFREAQQALS